MAKQFPGLEDAHARFIAEQPIFFVATAARGRPDQPVARRGWTACACSGQAG